MRILSVHGAYKLRGGEDEVREAEVRLLEQMGHQVDSYGEDNERIATLNSIDLAAKTLWSNEAYQALRQQLVKQPCDVMHVQNFFPLISPSAYYAARAEGVPVVQTLHNYRLLCPNALFFRSGAVCEDCLGKWLPWPSIVHGCYRDSKAASGVTAAMLAVHRTMHTWSSMVDVYIALTNFARQKFIQGGLPAEKIVVKPNFVSSDPGIGSGKGGYALYVGRLSVEKGIDTLLAAWGHLKGNMTLKIVGVGPVEPQVIEASKRLPAVEWLGRRSLKEVYDLMGEASFLIFPSNWYETFGRVAIEAFAKGTPVIASNIGAITELIEHGRTGLLFSPGDPVDLADKVSWLMAHPQELRQMRQAARDEFEKTYTAEDNYKQLMEIYTLASKSRALSL